ncbi:class I SAM-dependent methyltransferase [Streptomyces hokutonensis]|uniref:class I SAM-dependent methyltransferase n=1 Tax=Streptomyces hokutonensis TaxID=1306990 RepID=UPI0038149493
MHGSAEDVDYGVVGGRRGWVQRVPAAGSEDRAGVSRGARGGGGGRGECRGGGRFVRTLGAAGHPRRAVAFDACAAAWGLAEAVDSVDALDAVAEQLPFPDGAFDAAMTTFSVHQWSDPAAGLREMLRCVG